MKDRFIFSTCAFLGMFVTMLIMVWYYVKKKYNLNVEFNPINIL